MGRGIDLPDDTLTYAVLVGTPYRPPESFDNVPEFKTSTSEIVQRSTMIEYRVFINSFDPTRSEVFAHIPHRHC